jgi:hypothetical protein
MTLQKNKDFCTLRGCNFKKIILKFFKIFEILKISLFFNQIESKTHFFIDFLSTLFDFHAVHLSLFIRMFPDQNHPVYTFELMSICGFAILFEVYYKKTPNIDGGDTKINIKTNVLLMDSFTEIIWPHFRRAQLYDQDIMAVKIDFGETGVHQVDAMIVQFSAKFSCGTAVR